MTKFSVAGAEGYMTVSYPDDGLGEVFLKLGKQGSTLAGVMDAFSIAISIALQHGVPLETYVNKFTNMRFDPAGMTDTRTSGWPVGDGLHLPSPGAGLPALRQRSALGIYTAAERTRQLETGPQPLAEEEDPEVLAQSAPVSPGPPNPLAAGSDPAAVPAAAPPGRTARRSCWSPTRAVRGRAAVPHLRHQDAPRRHLLRLRRLRQHERLQLKTSNSCGRCNIRSPAPGGVVSECRRDDRSPSPVRPSV